jgi:hypothetical protein
VLTLARCPNCGAPVNAPPSASHVICVYCNQSLLVAQQPGTQQTSLKVEGLPPLEVARVKDLLLDGKRDQAIAHYMRLASIPRSEAEAAVDALAIKSFFQYTRHLPINAAGFVLHFAILLLVVGLGAFSVFLTQYSIIFWLFLALPIVLFFLRVAAFYRHVSATWTAAFGSKGNAKVLRCGVLREVNADAFHTVCHFEVTPADGSETFQDQEVLYVGAETLKKLQAGNVVNVRYDGSRQHVYIQTPVVVLSTG